MTLDGYLGVGVVRELGTHLFEADSIKAFARKFAGFGKPVRCGQRFDFGVAEIFVGLRKFDHRGRGQAGASHVLHENGKVGALGDFEKVLVHE